MRAPAEIVERIETMFDPFGWQSDVLVTCLDFDHARPYLVADATAEQWAAEAATTDEVAVANMRDYMGFAWTKARDHRGLSANRSVERMIAWLFALGADELLILMESAPYAMYGAPRLRVVCEAYGFPVPDDLPVRRMCEGLPCREGCGEGCGK